MDKICKNCRHGRNMGTMCAQSGTVLPIVEPIKDCGLFEQVESVKCFCLQTRRGNLICPLTTNREDLEKTLNYKVLGDAIVEVDINKDFVCPQKRTEHCKNCPFK